MVEELSRLMEKLIESIKIFRKIKVEKSFFISEC